MEQHKIIWLQAIRDFDIFNIYNVYFHYLHYIKTHMKCTHDATIDL